MKNEKNYNIGLDIGVASVGWCVTDEESNILKRNGKNMWGSRIFDEANTAKNTRMFRANRRRLNRRKERINILQSLLNEDMEKEYPSFFPMLRESYKDQEDKEISQNVFGKKYNLFSEEKMTDKTYYHNFKTIYHLRNYLVNTPEKVDIRLVYLAIHHIIKYRGNFLYDGNFAENTAEVEEVLDRILIYLKESYEIELIIEKNKFFEILTAKNTSKTVKKEKIISSFNFEKQDKQIVTNIAAALIGSKFELSKIFENIELSKDKIAFSIDIENEDEIITELQENAEIYECMKTIYSWYILQDILNGKTYISEAFIDKYEKYSKDLELLKKLYRQYFPTEYNAMFRKIGENNYVAYNGKNSGHACKKCKPEDFFANLKNKIKQLPDDCPEKEYIEEELNNENFLKKINVTDNGAIPHQLHQKELEKILENQSKYYTGIAENKEKILKLFKFRIPYYVGPLSKKEGKWSWVVRKSDEQIRPWNFDGENGIIDTDATAEKFIKRMTNKCTYILNEEVMPKQSILYSEFCVLNELNNIRVNNKHLGKDEKEKIINILFKNKKKVTVDMLKDFLRYDNFAVDTITGLSDESTFNSNMASYIDMKKIFEKVDETNIEQIEKIIYYITIFEDKKILKRKIKKEYPNITKEQLNALVKLKYTGWSRLSKKLIAGIKSYDGDTIIEKLEKTSLNFMQIINEKKFGFDKQLEALMPKTSGKIEYKDIEELQTSPANKRAIWQAVCVVKEIKKIMKTEPKNIYIEFARNEEKKVMKDNRAKQLLKKYEEINKQLKYLKDYQPYVYQELKQHQNDKSLSEKMYLYYIQNGKSLYSGKTLDIDELSQYEVDHILPQSYIKDDSIDNKALVLRNENQRKKDSLLLDDKIIDSMSDWWKSLLEAGLITQTKYFRLTKRKMLETDAEKEKFIQRQLVETRQITKYVANLLSNTYKETQVYSLRAELTHGFREKYKIYKNRNVNNFHHAHDAYILSVIGNIIDREWHRTEQFKYSEYVKNYFKDEKTKEEKYGIIMGFISKHVNIEKVKKTLNHKDCFISRMLIEETGEFYNQTLYSPNDSKNKPVISLKNNKPAEKYGGYSGENKAFFTIFSFICKGKEEYQLIGIPIQVAYKIKSGKESLENYIKNTYLVDVDYTKFKIIRSKILKNQEYLDENNELMRFCSDTEIRPAKELIVDKNMTEQIYLMNTPENKLDDIQKAKINYEYMYDYLCNKIKNEYKCLENVLPKLLASKENFLELDSNNKKGVINKLIDMIENRYVNLKEIGLGSSEGRMSSRNFNTKKLLTMIFINKSVTGMYERRYRINGVENSSSK